MLAESSFPNYYVFISLRTVVVMVSTSLLKDAAKRQAEIDEATAEFLAKGGSIGSCPTLTPRAVKTRVSEAYRRKRRRQKYEKRILGPNPHAYN